MEIEAEVIRNTYKSLLEKREQALMRVNLQRRQIAEQFVLLDVARLPERPDRAPRAAPRPSLVELPASALRLSSICFWSSDARLPPGRRWWRRLKAEGTRQKAEGRRQK
jgi:hypothetical protein